MSRIPNIWIVFQQWTNVSDERFTNYFKFPRGKTSEEDTNSLKSFGDNDTYVRFKREVRVYISSKIRNDTNLIKVKTVQ